MTATETDTIEQRLAEVEPQIAGLTSHREPRVLAKRLVDLLDRRDALRIRLGTHVRCAHCCGTFVPARADCQYCCGACRQAAYRQRVTDNTEGVTATTAKKPRCGVLYMDGPQGGLMAATTGSGRDPGQARQDGA